METSFQVLASFSNSITSHAKVSHQNWPNVTIGDFTSMAIQSVQLVGSGKIVFAPLVRMEDRLGFEGYVDESIYPQIQEYLDYVGAGENATEVEGLYKQIVAVNMETKGRSVAPYEGPDVKSEYLVLWQSVCRNLSLPGDYNFASHSLHCLNTATYSPNLVPYSS